MIKENIQARFRDLLRGFLPVRGTILEPMYDRVIYTGTARAALRIVLDYLRSRGIIENKNGEVVVAQWMCTSVYHIMHKACFPMLAPTGNTKGVMPYHQYGFPQNMDAIMDAARQHRWFVIENCVNVFDSSFKGRRLGTFGMASIFSLSKMFPSIQGGALVCGDDELLAFAKGAVDSDRAHFTSIVAHWSRLMSETGTHPFWDNIQEMAYGSIDGAKRISRVSLNIVRREVAAGAMERRRQNYRLLLDSFSGEEFFRGLEPEVTPYVVPLIAEEAVLRRIKDKLGAAGVWTDLYHFDVNRNLLDPLFKRCVWIPVHQGIDASMMEKISSLIKSAA